MPPVLNFAPLENGFAALQRTAEAYDQALAQAAANGGGALARASLREVNTKLIAVERALTLNEGLPNRPWFKHQIYAPGFYTGYGVKTLPAVRESIEQKEWKLADEQIARVGKVLENAGEAIQGATTELMRGRAVAALSAAPALFQLLIDVTKARELSRELGIRAGAGLSARAEILPAEEVAARDHGRAHGPVFVGALRPCGVLIQPRKNPIRPMVTAGYDGKHLCVAPLLPPCFRCGAAPRRLRFTKPRSAPVSYSVSTPKMARWWPS